MYVDPLGTDFWPAVEVRSPVGVSSGKKVTYWVYQPAGSTLGSVVPYVSDLNWAQRSVAPVTLVPGWNQVVWTVPSVNGINAVGLQLNDDAGWRGEILLDTVTW